MAFPITTAATTLEQQLLELLNRTRIAIRTYEEANPLADLKGFRFTSQVNLIEQLAFFSVTLPLTLTNKTDGGLRFNAAEAWIDAALSVEPMLINGQIFTINGLPILFNYVAAGDD
jgi:hypothetical protein